MIIDTHKTYIPAFGFQGIKKQSSVCRVVVLILGESKRDCAAYEGIVRADYSGADLENVRSLGNKISKSEAEDMFNLSHGGIDLTYRR